MRTNISCSFLRSRKVAGLAVLFSAIFGASSNVLAQEGSDVINLGVGQSTATTVSVSRQVTAATQVLVFTGSTPTWSVLEDSSSGSVVIEQGGGKTATVVYTFSPPGGNIGFGANDRFVVGVSADDERATLTFSVTIAADSPMRYPPVISYDGDDQVSTVPIDSYERVSTADFVLSASNPDPVGGDLNWSLTTPTSAGTAVFVTSDGGTSVRLTTGDGDPATIRFTRPDPDDDFRGTTFRVTATGDDSGLSDSVVVDIVNEPNTTPTIVVADGGTSLRTIHAYDIDTYIELSAAGLDQGDDVEDLTWSVDVDKPEYSWVMSFLERRNADGSYEQQNPVVGSKYVRVFLNLNAIPSMERDGLATATFTVTLSDGLLATTLRLTLVRQANVPPEIVSIDGQTTSPFNFLVSPNSTVVTFPAIAQDIDNEGQLKWSILSTPLITDGAPQSTVTFISQDGRPFMEPPLGTTAVMIRLERKPGNTTALFTLTVDDSLGGENPAFNTTVVPVFVTVDAGESIPAIRFLDSQTISEGKTVEYTFTADGAGLGQTAGLKWSVLSTDNVVVSPSSAQGLRVMVTATLREVLSRLDGSYVLQVTNSDGNSTQTTVTVEIANEDPVITPGRVMLTLVGQNTTVINFSAVDTVGLTTLTWSFVGDASPDGDSTVRFVADNAVPSTRTTGTAVRVLFIGPPPSSERDIDRSFQVRVEDGLDGSSTAIVEIKILPNPVIYYRIRMFLGGAAR